MCKYIWKDDFTRENVYLKPMKGQKMILLNVLPYFKDKTLVLFSVFFQQQQKKGLGQFFKQSSIYSSIKLSFNAVLLI